MKDQEIKKDNLLPKQMVSADHFISRLQVGSTTRKGNQIHLIFSQEDVSLLTIPVVMRELSTKWL